ncbi:MAG: hypothetical protein O3C57_04555 [Verrucomicrobia bacterium]|nr:hypothetical protein [Verrucomicrobiota bacterium]
MKSENGGDHERERLRRWLVERELDARLRLESSALTRAPSASREDIPADDIDPAAPGQIRLLHPIDLTLHTPRYIAVLETRSTPDVVIVAPYSRYATPALPGELLTQRIAPPLRVLCLWNVCELDRQKLSTQSWLAGELSISERDDARQVREYLLAGLTCAEAVGARLGPRLLHPNDPRHNYIEEERAWRQSLGENKAPSTESRLRLYPLMAPDAPTLARAAESRTPYGHETLFAIDRFALRLRCETAPDQIRILIHVVDPQNHPSTRLDGGYLLTTEGLSSAPIWNGQCQIRSGKSISRVVTPQGETHRLHQTS